VTVVLLGALSPAVVPLAGQNGVTEPDAVEEQDPIARPCTPYDLERAQALLDEARLYEAAPDRSGWLEAARLHKASAALRPLGDEQVFRSLHRAAQIFHVLGHQVEAQRTLEQSVTHARLYGHIAEEAEALLGAAWVADLRGDVDAMNRHLSRAFLLTYSPLLPEETRQDVRRRVLLPAMGGVVATIVTD
jgi:hypothetical protein